jgi:hypothetical protein
MVMQKQMRVMLRTLNRLVHEKTAATAAAASRSAAGEPLWEHRPTWNARGVLADGEAVWAPLSPLAPMLRDSAKTFQPRAELGSGGVAPEQEALGKQFFLLGAGHAVEIEELRAGQAALLAREALKTEPKLSFVRDTLSGLVLLPGDALRALMCSVLLKGRVLLLLN